MPKKYVAVIQAGGKGTRMLELTKDEIPKPMLLLNGKPMLQWQIKNIADYGVTEFVIIIGHLGEMIKEYFGDGSRLGVQIEYIEEKEPLGSAGALYYLKDRYADKDFLLIYGDVMFELDWNRMIAFHEDRGAIATLLAHPNAHPYDSDLLMVETNGRVTGIDSKHNTRYYWYENLVNAGIYILDRQFLENFTVLEKKDLETEILCPLMSNGKIYAYRTPEYVKDAGTPERFRQVSREQEQGVWDRKCLKNKQRCVFLDRDGTINEHRGLVCKEEDFVLEKGVAEAIRRLNAAGYLAIVVTNQPVVARGMCDISDVENIHCKMQVLLGEEGAYLDDIVYCPHHPDKGYPEENPTYKIKCNCRKPATGMIDTMVRKYNIDIAGSYMVGDTTMDIQTGRNAGLKTILLGTGEAGADGKFDVVPDYKALYLMDAVDYILNQ